jgi:hypothetical protein
VSETFETSICGIGCYPRGAVIDGMPVCGQDRSARVSPDGDSV